jgi:hypothetical protein
MSWVRSGECCRCGQCCSGTPPPDFLGTPAMQRAPPVEGMCPLYEIRDGAGFCIGHTGAVPEGQEDAYYLAACNVWPTDPLNIADKPGCSYVFAWVDD